MTADQYNARQIIREAESSISRLAYTELKELINRLRYDHPGTYRIVKGILIKEGDEVT